DEPLLGSVVEIALELPTLFVTCPDDPGPRRTEIVPGLGARHGQGDELTERPEPALALRRQRLRARNGNGTPQDAGDHDRSRHGRPVADPHHQLRDLAGQARVVVDPYRWPGR